MSHDNLFDELPLPGERRPGGRGHEDSLGERPSIARQRDRLIRAAEPVLQAVLLLVRADAGFDPTIGEFRNTVRRALEEFRAQARRAGAGQEEIEAAEYALVAFTDEMVVRSNWSEKDAWLRDPLEKEVFGTAIAGEEFFARLGGLGDAMRPVLALYYLCLILGFEGKYQRTNPKNHQGLIEVIDALGSRLGVTAPDWEKRLFEQGYTKIQPTAITQRTYGRVWMVVGGASVAFLAILFIVYSILVQIRSADAASIILGG